MLIELWIGALVGLAILGTGRQMLQEWELERSIDVTRKFQEDSEIEDIIYPIGVVPVELDPQLATKEEIMKSIRVVAMLRRLNQERKALEVLNSSIAQGEDGKWRQNGKFISAALSSTFLAKRDEHSKVITDINGKLQALGVKA